MSAWHVIIRDAGIREWDKTNNIPFYSIEFYYGKFWGVNFFVHWNCFMHIIYAIKNCSTPRILKNKRMKNKLFVMINKITPSVHINNGWQKLTLKLHWNRPIKIKLKYPVF